MVNQDIHCSAIHLSLALSAVRCTVDGCCRETEVGSASAQCSEASRGSKRRVTGVFVVVGPGSRTRSWSGTTVQLAREQDHHDAGETDVGDEISSAAAAASHCQMDSAAQFVVSGCRRRYKCTYNDDIVVARSSFSLSRRRCHH